MGVSAVGKTYKPLVTIKNKDISLVRQNISVPMKPPQHIHNGEPCSGWKPARKCTGTLIAQDNVQSRDACLSVGFGPNNHCRTYDWSQGTCRVYRNSKQPQACGHRCWRYQAR